MPRRINYVEITRNWVKQFVIDLNLCPFAAKPFMEDSIKYVISIDDDLENILAIIISEVEQLIRTKPAEKSTTLIIVPYFDHSFIEYLEFYNLVDLYLEESGYNDQLQLASFHPLYQFEGTDTHSVSNYTNRAPYSIIHLLRVSEVEQAIKNHPDTEKIPERNIELLERMGREELLARLDGLIN